jgi:hypothetical protein
LHDPHGYLSERGKLCGTEAPRTSDDLVTIAVGPHGDGLNDPLRSQTFGKLGQPGLIEGAAGVGGGLVDAGEGDGLIL